VVDFRFSRAVDGLGYERSAASVPRSDVISDGKATSASCRSTCHSSVARMQMEAWPKRAVTVQEPRKAVFDLDQCPFLFVSKTS
jgi:hypothetical protein